MLPAMVFLYVLPGALKVIYKATDQRNYDRYIAEASSLLANLDQLANDTTATMSFAQVGSPSAGRDQDSAQTGASSSLRKPKPPTLNTVSFSEADSILLQAVTGVGPVISSRIVKYRDRLGGFHDPAQLLEVYGVDEELAEKIYRMFPFDPSIVRTLKVNEMSARELSQHPYLNMNEARVIYAYRTQHGPFSKPEDLLRIKIFSEEWIARVAPYMSF